MRLGLPEVAVAVAVGRDPIGCSNHLHLHHHHMNQPSPGTNGQTRKMFLSNLDVGPLFVPLALPNPFDALMNHAIARDEVNPSDRPR